MNKKEKCPSFDSYDEVPDYIKDGIESLKKMQENGYKLIPAPAPPVMKPKVSLKCKLKNLKNSITRIVKDTFEGKDVIASEELINTRMEICKNCKYISENKTYCTECGCILSFKTKFKSSECPKKYW